MFLCLVVHSSSAVALLLFLDSAPITRSQALQAALTVYIQPAVELSSTADHIRLTPKLMM
jgi:hypothetical protein